MSEGERAAATGEEPRSETQCWNCGHKKAIHDTGHDAAGCMRGDCSCSHFRVAPREPEPPAQPTRGYECDECAEDSPSQPQTGTVEEEKREECPFTVPVAKCIRPVGHDGQHNLALARAAPPIEREARLEEALREADEYTWHHSGCAMWPPDRGGLMPGEPDPCDCGYRGMLDMVRAALAR